MHRKSLVAVALVALVALAAGGRVAYSFLKPPAEASGSLRVIPLKAGPAAPSTATAAQAPPADRPESEAGAPEAGEPGTDAAVDAGVAMRIAAPAALAPVEPEAVEPEAVEPEAVEPAPVEPDAVASDRRTAGEIAEPDTEGAPEAKRDADPVAAPSATPPSGTAPSETALAEARGDEAAPPAAESRQRVFQIDPEHSTARFDIDEVLRGEPKTVLGATDQVSGQFGILGDSLATVSVGTVLVNARTFATDNKFRDRSIKNKILKTDDFEYIRFEPTAVEGVPATVAPGEDFHFRVTGELTITDVTHAVTFDLQARFLSNGEVEGLARTAFPYTDFRLAIPKPPVVASVADTVHLEVDFQAREVY